MNRANKKQKIMWGAALVAMVLAATVPVLAMAEATALTPATAMQTTTASDATANSAQLMGHGGHGFGLDGYGLNTSSLTDKQKAVYKSAISLYEQVEDKVLHDLVTAGVVTQADVVAYAVVRTAEKSLSELDQSIWTTDQYKAFYEANEKTGDDRTAAMQALVTAGQLTQAQADALRTQGQDNLWKKVVKNAGTNPAIKTAIQTMRQARQTLKGALSAAGIQGKGKGGMFGGFCNGFESGQGGNQNNGRSGNPNMRRRMGGRR